MVFMKTVGERIRQAREGLAMSGEELAQKAGYKTQSGIGNLEFRPPCWLTEQSLSSDSLVDKNI